MFEVIQHPAFASPSTIASTGPPASRTVSHDHNGTMRSTFRAQILTEVDIERIDSITSSMRMVKNGTSLYRENDPFRNIYTVYAGSFKTIVMRHDGHQQVTGFHLVGDTLGFDGIYNTHHNWTAVAIEDSNVRITPFHLLERLCCEVTTIQKHMHRLMSSEIARESQMMLLLGTMPADQRLATFLLSMSARLNIRGYSPVEFNLRMTRGEIGSYLGMQLETVSRMFSRLQLDGLIITHGKDIRILDLDGLSRV